MPHLGGEGSRQGSEILLFPVDSLSDVLPFMMEEEEEDLLPRDEERLELWQKYQDYLRLLRTELRDEPKLAATIRECLRICCPWPIPPPLRTERTSVDVAVQVDLPEETSVDVALQVDLPEQTSVDMAVQADLPEQTSMDMAVQADLPESAGQTQEVDAERALVSRRPYQQHPNRACWNCWRTGHRYSDCPKPRGDNFCYGCGENAVTLRTCPWCRKVWQREGKKSRP